MMTEEDIDGVACWDCEPPSKPHFLERNHDHQQPRHVASAVADFAATPWHDFSVKNPLCPVLAQLIHSQSNVEPAQEANCCSELIRVLASPSASLLLFVLL